MAAYGGMERHICTLAARMAARGHRVTFLTTSNSLGPELRNVITHPSITFRELPAARSTASRFRKSLWLLLEVLRCRTQSWDLIYTNGQSALARLVWHAGSGSTRRVHHHHTAADTGEQRTWSRSFRRVLQRSAELVACSEFTRDSISVAIGRTDIHFLPYLTRQTIEGHEVAECAPGSSLHFGFMGRLVPEKGIDAICRLSNDPSLSHISWHLHGAGDLYPPEFFRNYPRVTYHGAFSADTQAHALLALDALVLFSSHNEGMPLSLIEGMSAGLPWIATDRGGTRELARRLSDCIVVPHPANDTALRFAILTLSHRIRSRLTSRIAQRRIYDHYFAPNTVADRWLAFFENRPPAASREAVASTTFA
jgi:glycosyltransferase involved in cell wall biosynthesis